MNLFLNNGINTSFGTNYNVQCRVKDIWIGKGGKMINAHLSESPETTEREIEKALNKNIVP